MFVSVPETVQQTTSDIILHHIIQYEVQSFKIIILKKKTTTTNSIIDHDIVKLQHNKYTSIKYKCPAYWAFVSFCINTSISSLSYRIHLELHNKTWSIRTVCTMWRRSVFWCRGRRRLQNACTMFLSVQVDKLRHLHSTKLDIIFWHKEPLKV
jgi:hypothetical protein